MTDYNGSEQNTENTNNAPVTTGEHVSIRQDTRYSFSTYDLLANDSDPDGDPISFDGIVGATGGLVRETGYGSLEFIPNPGFSGTATITYAVRDSFGAASTATIDVNVIANNAPVATGEQISIRQDTRYSFSTYDLLANDRDPDGDPISFDGIVGATGGLVRETGYGSLEFIPNPGFSGTATITYAVRDSFGAASTATIDVNVIANNAPVATGEQISIRQDTRYSFSTYDLLANDRDPDGDPISFDGIVGATGGLVRETGYGSLEFIPNPGFSGTATITYAVRDSFGAASTATIDVNVIANNAPVATGEQISIRQDTRYSFSTYDLLANDRDPDGDLISFDGIVGATGGLVRETGYGSLEFIPNPGFSGTATITYAVRDSFGAASTATIDVNVIANNAPVATGEQISIRQDTRYSFSTYDLLANDRDPDGDLISFDGIVGATGGLVRETGYGSLEFIPNPGFSGTATITYAVRDSFGAASTATIDVNVIANNAPVANGEQISIPQDTRYSFSTYDLLANDSDPDGDLISFDGIVGATGGLVRETGYGSLEFIPNPGFSGTATITYAVRDSFGAVSTATLDISVGTGAGTNTAPTSGTDLILATQPSPQPVLITQAELLANDADPDGDAFSITGVFGAQGGSVGYDANGNILFTPNDGFSGQGTFIYRTTDARGAESFHTVTVDVPTLPTVTVSPVLAGQGQTALASYQSQGGENSDMAALAGGGHVVAWRHGQTVTAQIFDASGTKVAEVHPQFATSPYPGMVKVAALPDGGFVAAWYAYDETWSNAAVFAQRYNSDGTANGAAFAVNPVNSYNHSMGSVTALSDGSFVVTYQSYLQDANDWGVFGRKFNANGTAGAEFRINAATGGDQTAPTVIALQNGEFGVLYRNSYSSNRFQRFDSSSGKIGAEVVIGGSDIAAIATYGAGFIATWSTDNSIVVQKFGADGTALASPQTVPTAAQSAYQLGVTALHDGGYVLNWTSVTTVGYSQQYDQVAQRFDAQGNAVTQPFRVHAPDNTDEYSAKIIERADGTLVATWTGGMSTEVKLLTSTLEYVTAYQGNNANNTLAGGAGTDLLVGGGRADTYLAGLGSGADIIDNVGQGADGDRVLFGSGITTDQLWFSRTGDDLKVAVIGTGDSVSIQYWYKTEANHVSAFETADGHTLDHAQVTNLVQAMSTFAPPPAGQTQLSAEQHQALDTVIAANWQHS